MAARGLSFFFDFASPYAYLAFDEVLRIGAEAGLPVTLRPAMVWAILKAQGIPPPMETETRRRYMLADMERSAAFFGLPYRQPDPLPMSAHLALRMWIGFAGEQPDPPVDLIRALFRARFAQGLDLRDPAVLATIALDAGYDPDRAARFMEDAGCRDQLRQHIDDAVALGVPGVPCVVLGQELFFGADRLPQLRWRLGLAQREPAAAS